MAKKTKQVKEQDIFDIEDVDLTQAGEPEQELPSAGLGDTIKTITSALGIKQCEGCKNRQKEYNKIFPWLKLSRPLTDAEIDWVLDVSKRGKMDNAEVNRIFQLYNELFPSKRPIQRCNCPGTIVKLIERIKTFIEE